MCALAASVVSLCTPKRQSTGAVSHCCQPNLQQGLMLPSRLRDGPEHALLPKRETLGRSVDTSALMSLVSNLWPMRANGFQLLTHVSRPWAFLRCHQAQLLIATGKRRSLRNRPHLSCSHLLRLSHARRLWHVSQRRSLLRSTIAISKPLHPEEPRAAVFVCRRRGIPGERACAVRRNQQAFAAAAAAAAGTRLPSSNPSFEN
jgi:hypothetical protein